MGGFIVRQPLPAKELENLDPFLLLHHAVVSYKNSPGADQSGVGPHPHRGFSPVTFVFKGGVHHRDSLGNNSVVYEGGVQWINSGSGIVHSERPPKELIGSDEEQEFIQLWVNTPAQFKMADPSYQGFSKEDIPFVLSRDEKIRMSIVSGSVFGCKGPVESTSPVNSVMLSLKKGGETQIQVEHSHVAFIYLLNGEIKVNGQNVNDKNLIVFGNEGDSIEIEVLQDGDALFLSGKPIGEPVETYGPFVMNSRSEIIEALNDAQNGKMGMLVEEF